MAQFVIEILDGDRAGEVVTLPTRPLRIGRKPGNDLVIVDEKTSGSHAEVAPDGERFVLRDLGSTNGTFLDGKRVTEVGLTPGDVFVVGRVKMCFRPEGASVAGAAGNGEGFEVHRIDQAMLQRARRSRSAALLWVLLLCGIGCAAWLLFVRTAGGGGGPVGPSKKNPLVVAGNLLPADVAGCEGEDGWVLGGGGAGFAVAGGANTGHGAFEALRSAGAGAAAYALARSKEPRLVLGGKTLTVAAYLHTENGAQAAVRLHFFSSQDGNLFHFRTGSRLQAFDHYTRADCAAAVPPGADRVEIELVALLPNEGAAAYADDVALTEGGEATAINLQLETGALIGTGAAIAVSSIDAQSPAILLDLSPEVGAGPLAALRDDGLLCLSDVGGTLTAQKNEHGFELTVAGTDGVQLSFPAESAGGLLARSQDAFAAIAPESTFAATELLLGDKATRCLLRRTEAAQYKGRLGGGRLRLATSAGAIGLQLHFATARSAAIELLEQAKRSRLANKPGEALDKIKELQRTVPHDTEVLGRALRLRGEITQAMGERLRQLAIDLEEAEFFDTRGGFARVIAGIDELVAQHGEQNLEDQAATMALRSRAAGRLQAIDNARSGELRTRLEQMATALQSKQPGLAKLVQDHLGRE